MAYEVVVPRLGLTMEEGRVVEWFVEPGDPVEAGEPLFAIETDKVVLEVEAAVGGIVYPLPDLPDEPMPIGRLIGYILAPGEDVPETVVSAKAASPVTQPSSAPAQVANRSCGEGDHRKLSSPAARRRAAELGLDWRMVEREGDGPILVTHVEAAARARAEPPRIAASPVARRLAKNAGIDLAELAALKPGQKILRADVEAAIAKRSEAGPGEESEAPAEPLPEPNATPGRVAPISQTRRIIARRMVEGSQLTAPVTLTTEADASELVAVREQFKTVLGPRNILVPTYTDLMIKLTAIALSEHPMLNAIWQEDGILVPDNIHIAMAVDVESGLVVPVIHDVMSKSIQQIAEESRMLAQKARNRKLGVDDLQSGTFTITNLGTYGIDAFSPIINLPQCAILGVGRIVEKPAVVDGDIVPRKMVALSLTFDHRVVDGGPAARFLDTVREHVEQPYLWLSQ